MKNNVNKLDSDKFILVSVALIIFDLFLIMCFIGDLAIITGVVESDFLIVYGLYPLVMALIIEIVLVTFSIIVWIYCFRRYKNYDK